MQKVYIHTIMSSNTGEGFWMNIRLLQDLGLVPFYQRAAPGTVGAAREQDKVRA